MFRVLGKVLVATNSSFSIETVKAGTFLWCCVDEIDVNTSVWTPFLKAQTTFSTSRYLCLEVEVLQQLCKGNYSSPADCCHACIFCGQSSASSCIHAIQMLISWKSIIVNNHLHGFSLGAGSADDRK